MISELMCEGLGIRSTARVLKIGINTVLRRIVLIAAGISKPPIPKDRPSFEVDELWTYIGKKENEYWLAGNVSNYLVLQIIALKAYK